MSSDQRAAVVESDPQYKEEVLALLAKVRTKQITHRKFNRSRTYAYQAALKRAGLLLEAATPADDDHEIVCA